MKQNLAIALFTFALNGCASLKVQVAVLNPTIPEAVTDRTLVRDALPQIRGVPESVFLVDITELENAHFAVYTRAQEAAASAAERATDATRRALLTNLAETLVPSFTRAVAPQYQAAQTELKKLRSTALALGDSLDVAPQARRAHLAAAIASKLRQASNIMKAMANFAAQDDAEISAARRTLMPGETASVDSAEAARQDAVRRSILRGDRIDTSPFAYAIASSDLKNEAAWAPQFNKVFGRGILGDVDLAVIVDPSGDFTLKGLTFDPSSVTHAASKALTQALLLSSQIAGVPVNLASTTARDSTGLVKASRELANANQASDEAAARVRGYDEALAALAAAILAEAGALASRDPAARAAAIAAIRGVFEAHKPRLNLTAVPPATPPGGNPNL
jgi:hypothetical protein